MQSAVYSHGEAPLLAAGYSGNRPDAGFCLPRPASPPLNAFKEVADVDLKGLRNVPQPTRRDTVRPNFVLLDLLKGDSQGVGKLLLGHPKLLTGDEAIAQAMFRSITSESA